MTTVSLYSKLLARSDPESESKSFRIMMNKVALLGFVLIPILLSGCAGDCSTFRAYNQTRNREEIAVLRADFCPVITFVAVDNKPVPRSTCYFFLEPGRHEFIVSYDDGDFRYNNVRKYLEAVAGHTYKMELDLKIKFFSKNKSSLNIVDVTNNPQLHITNLPEKARYHCE